MVFGLSTRWNAGRHKDGEAMIEEILALGFSRVELGYDLRIDLVPGVEKMLRQGAVTVDSVHNYCPVPVGAPRGHPELFTFADLDNRNREAAVHHTEKTIRFAASMGARVVVAHCGYVDMPRLTRQLIRLSEEGRQFDAVFEKTLLKLQIQRDKKVAKHLVCLRSCIDALMPILEETGVTLALENLPTWEGIPSELEMKELCEEYDSPHLRCWHDIGHAQVRHNLGLINQERWIERLKDCIAGVHIHDVAPPAADHLMPPLGKVDFARLRMFARMNVLRVLEPAPQTPPEHITRGLQYLKETWGADSDSPTEVEE